MLTGYHVVFIEVVDKVGSIFVSLRLMTGASPSENPFKVISARFDQAYGLEEAISIGSIGLHEFIGGRQADGGELAIYRPSIALATSGPEVFRVQDAPPVGEEDIPEDDGDDPEPSREYLVGGSAEHPVACEVLSFDPLETRLLDTVEMIALARKIGGTEFR